MLWKINGGNPGEMWIILPGPGQGLKLELTFSYMSKDWLGTGLEEKKRR